MPEEIAVIRHEQEVRRRDASPHAYLGRLLSHRPTLRIGSRTSPMALAQAHHVQRLIAEVVDIHTEIVGIQTSGDRWMGDLSDLGGKGAFVNLTRF